MAFEPHSILLFSLMPEIIINFVRIQEMHKLSIHWHCAANGTIEYIGIGIGIGIGTSSFLTNLHYTC